MKKTIKRSGFTIVELVIVIAVIAVLAGVLIPTFGGIIERANESNDNQVVATVNKLLVVDNIIKGDDPNDAVEIKKMLKDNGVSLKTKSEGKYIWYDIDQNKVILAGLDANGIVFLNDNDKDPNASATKGTFKAATAPELFIDGYVFLSDESDDGLAEAICGLRNPKDYKSIDNDLTKIAKINETLGEKLRVLMNRTVVLTKDNGAVFIGDNPEKPISKDNVTKVIVSSEKTTLFKSDIDTMSAYKNIIVVDLHSGVVEMNTDTLTAIDANTIFYVYDSDVVKTKYDTNPDIQLLIPKSKRPDFIGTLKLEYIYLDAEGKKQVIHTVGEGDEFKKSEFTINYQFPYLYFGATDGAYEFEKYSLFENGANSIDVGTNGYTLNDEEQYLIKNDNGNAATLTLYAIFKPVRADFMLKDNKLYSSNIVTDLLTAQNGFDKTTYGTTITVVSTEAVLGDATHTEITIPTGVELLVPTLGYDIIEEETRKKNDDGTYSMVKTGHLIIGDAKNSYAKFPVRFKKAAEENEGDVMIKRGSFVDINKDTVAGQTKLTIYNGVQLTFAQGATLYVDAIPYYQGTSNQFFIDEKCGVLAISDGAKITCNSGLTAYGIIRSEGTNKNGEIVVNGGTVTEILSIRDWYGGSNAAVSVGTGDGFFDQIIGSIGGAVSGLDLGGKNVCPFNEWKADNIRAKTTLKSNCVYMAIVGIYLDKPVIVDNFVLASNGTSAPLFQLTTSTSYIEKTVTSDGDVKLSLYGTIVDASKSMTMNVSGVDVEISFAKIPMPISHMDIYVAPNSSLTISKNLYNVMPGSDIVVDGTLKIQENAKVVMWKSNDVKFVQTFETNFRDFDTKKDVYTLELTEDGKIKKITCQTWKWRLSWKTDGDPTVKTATESKYYISIPHKFSESTPAKLVVNGSLEIASGDRFRGEITSTNTSGTATVTTTGGAVNSCSFPKGWFIQSSFFTNAWYDVYNSNQYGDKTWNGSYTYKYDTQLEYYTWQK